SRSPRLRRSPPTASTMSSARRTWSCASTMRSTPMRTSGSRRSHGCAVSRGAWWCWPSRTWLSAIAASNGRTEGSVATAPRPRRPSTKPSRLTWRCADRPILRSHGGIVMSDDNTKVQLPNLDGNGAQAMQDSSPLPEDVETSRTAADLEAVFDVPVQVSAVLGRARMEVGDLLKLGPGTVLELDRKVGESIDIYVNNRLVARGEVVLVEEKLGVTMTEIIKQERN